MSPAEVHCSGLKILLEQGKRQVKPVCFPNITTLTRKLRWAVPFVVTLLLGCSSLDMPAGYPALSHLESESAPFHEKNMAVRFLEESKSVFLNKGNLASLGLATLASGGLMLTVDGPIGDYLEDHKLLEGLEPVGDFTGYAFPIALIVGTRAYAEMHKDTETVRTSKAAMDAALLTFLYGEALVTAVGRERPGGDKGHTHFEPFGYPGNRSFPMLHTAIMNSQLKVLAELYPEKKLFMPLLRYPLVGLVAYLRMEKGAHWISDVLPGIVLSEVVGKEVAGLYSGKERQSNWSVVAYPGGMGILARF